MRPGDVAFSAGSHLAGWLIRTGDHSRYNHTRLVVDEDGTVAEALGGGFSYGKVQPGDVIASPPLSELQRSRIPAIADELIGTPYGYLDVVVLGLAQIGLAHGLVRRRIESPRRLFCSMAVDYVWHLAGFKAFDDGRTFLNVTPGDIADLAFRLDWETSAVPAPAASNTSA